jgi:hypothetical protein
MVVGIAPSFANIESLPNGKVLEFDGAETAAKNIFGAVENLRDLDENLLVENVAYKLKLKDTETGMADVTLNGSFEVNGEKAKFKSDGKVRKYEMEGETPFYRGSLDGNIEIAGIERKIFVALGKIGESVYFAITINDFSSEEGFMVIQFGDFTTAKSISEKMEVIDAREVGERTEIVDPVITPYAGDSPY